ncbi:MAG: hypothetical protein ACJ79S_11440 [Gemmatimonadaceae bacterium]
MPRYKFALSTLDEVREAGIVQSDSFAEALTAIGEQAVAREGDTLEIGVAGFPPARYEYLGVFRGRQSWRPAGQLAA